MEGWKSNNKRIGKIKRGIDVVEKGIMGVITSTGSGTRNRQWTTTTTLSVMLLRFLIVSYSRERSTILALNMREGMRSLRPRNLEA